MNDGPKRWAEARQKGINDAMTGHDGRTPDRGPPPSELSSLSSSADEEEGVRVCVRIRPLSFENNVDDVRPRAYVLAAEEDSKYTREVAGRYQG